MVVLLQNLLRFPTPTKMRSLSEAEKKALTLVELRIMAAKAGLRYCSDLKKKDLMDPILGKR